MRLLNIYSLELEEFPNHNPVPPYAILSHRWSRNEVSFEDVKRGNPDHTASSWTKILSFLERAKSDFFDYAWIDTCCIDKRSSAELAEAINSMFRWYQQAARCYVYLEDVQDCPKHSLKDIAEVESITSMSSDCLNLSIKDRFLRSEWFTRAWTLQELLAPPQVNFFSRSWRPLGDRSTLIQLVHKATGISTEVLCKKVSLGEVDIQTKVSWVKCRQTTRTEDLAYSLLGIFDVNMPLVYGEGEKAIYRLQEEILKTACPTASEMIWYLRSSSCRDTDVSIGVSGETKSARMWSRFVEIISRWDGSILDVSKALETQLAARMIANQITGKDLPMCQKSIGNILSHSSNISHNHGSSCKELCRSRIRFRDYNECLHHLPTVSSPCAAHSKVRSPDLGRKCPSNGEMHDLEKRLTSFVQGNKIVEKSTPKNEPAPPAEALSPCDASLAASQVAMRAHACNPEGPGQNASQLPGLASEIPANELSIDKNRSESTESAPLSSVYSPNGSMGFNLNHDLLSFDHPILIPWNSALDLPSTEHSWPATDGWSSNQEIANAHLKRPLPRSNQCARKTLRLNAPRCDTCGKCFTRLSDRERHRSDVHGLTSRYYDCHDCTYRTKRKDKAMAHCRRMHKRNADEGFSIRNVRYGTASTNGRSNSPDESTVGKWPATDWSELSTFSGSERPSNCSSPMQNAINPDGFEVSDWNQMLSDFVTQDYVSWP